LTEESSKWSKTLPAFFIFLFACGSLYAIDRDRTIDQLYHTGWTYIEGAPTQVQALAQSTDGYLWLGTATGLFRFDGIKFELYKPPSGQTFRERNVASLYASPDGGLWVGYWYGGVSLIKDGSVTEYGPANGLPSAAVSAFARDRHGSIWIAAGRDGLAKFDGSHWKKVGAKWGFASPANTVFVDRAGAVWVGTPNAVMFLADGSSQFQIAAQGLLRVKGFAQSPNGTMWMAETGYGVRPIPLSRKSIGSPRAILVGSQAITFDTQGSLWITTLGNGIRRVPYPDRLHEPGIKGPSAWQVRDPQVEGFTSQNGLTSDYIHCVLQDREGNVWIGTSDGLDRFRQSSIVSVTVQPILTRGDPPIPSLHSFTTSALTVADADSLWMAGIGPQVLLNIHNNNVVTQLRDRYVDCMYRDQGGDIWFATPWSIFRLGHRRGEGTGLSAPGEVYEYTASVPLGKGLILHRLKLPTTNAIGVSLQSRVKAITQDKAGKLWVSMESGTFRLERSTWTPLERLGGPRGSATAEFTDAHGRIWFGFVNTVAMLDGDKVTKFTRSDGVQIGTVTSIQSKGNDIWIGGEFGLEILKGNRFQPVNPADGSTFNGVSGIVAPPEGGLWFSEHRGVVHLPEAEVQPLLHDGVTFNSFGVLDGLTAELRGAFASPSATLTSDGRIWFATTKGVAWINPKRVVRNTVPPSISIESVITDGTKHRADGLLQLPPRTKNLKISYTATSLTIPERVRFRYKLEGQDTEWQDAGSSREASYTNLDPASYRFRVIACNNDGVWNEIGATLNFVVLPAFYQTPWFKLLCILAFLGCLWLLYLLRLRQVTSNVQARLSVRMEERVHIARELHDTLLQGFQGLVLRFDAAMKTIPKDHPSRNLMEAVLDRADVVLLEGRESVRNLRQDDISATELLDKLTHRGEELRQTNPIRFRVSLIGSPERLDPTVGEEAYRIGSEALANAFLHSGSSEIELEITYDRDHLRLRIRDNGLGISQAVLHRGKDGHWGLVGMRERAQKIGGQLKIWSHENAGTEVELAIPVAIAYPSGHQRSARRWLKRFWG